MALNLTKREPILYLHYQKGLSYREISHLLQVRPHSIKATLISFEVYLKKYYGTHKLSTLWLQKIEPILHAHYQDKLSIPDICKITGENYDHVSTTLRGFMYYLRSFKQRLAKPNWLQRHERIFHAYYSKRKSMQEIAKENGCGRSNINQRLIAFEHWLKQAP